MALGSLVVTLGLDAAKFVSGLTKAEQEAKRWRDTSVKAAQQFGAIAGTAAVAAGVALVAVTKKAIDAADELSKTAQKVGITTEALSGLAYAAELSGVSSETLSTSLSKLNKNISEAAQGSKEQAEAFDAIGVSATNADGSLRGADKVLADIATKFSSYADGAEKSAIAQALFGRSGAELIPLLNSGADGLEKMRAEAEKLGIIIDTKTGKDAEAFNDTITKLGKSVDALGLGIAKELLPTLQAIADKFVDMQSEGGGVSVVVEAVSEAFKALTVLGANVAFVFVGIGREIGAIAAQAAALARADFSGFSAISDAVKADAARARKELDEFERRVLGLGSGSSEYSNEGRNRQATKPKAPRLGGGGKAGGGGAVSEAARYLESLGRQIEGLKDLSAVEKALADIQAGRIKGITPALKAQIIAQATLLDQARQAKEYALAEQAAREGAAQLSARIYGAQVDEAVALRDGNVAMAEEIEILRGGEDARRAIERAHLSSAIAYKESTLSALENADAEASSIIILKEQIELLRKRQELLTNKQSIEVEKERVKEIKETNDFAKEFGLTFSSALEDAIVKSQSLRDVVKGLAQDLLRITTRKLVTEPLGNAITSGVGSSGWLSGIASLLSGYFGGGSASELDFTTTNIGGARANGGMVGPNLMHEVGERGSPEMLDVNGKRFLIMGNERGRITPTMIGGGRNFNATINLNMPAGASAATASQAGAAVARKLRLAEMRNS